MKKHQIDSRDPVSVHGRYLVHPSCYARECRYLSTLQLPRLDYRMVVCEGQNNSAMALIHRMKAVLVSGRKEGQT